MLGVPLASDYAFGHANGGSQFGATVDNAFTQSNSEAPSAKDQIAKYTGSSDSKKISDTLHFLWIGNNDVLPFLPGHIFFQKDNTGFATKLAAAITARVQTLLDAGATSIFVPNIYPRHIAPVVKTYFTNSTADIKSYGDAISQTNTLLEKSLEGLGDKVLYYDVFGFMLNVWENADSFGIKYTKPFADFVDGSKVDAVKGVSNWELGQVQGHTNEFFWMQYLDPTTHVHQLIATDMAEKIKAHWG
jgi:phospholipase/lecithinase/hemolysin